MKLKGLRCMYTNCDSLCNKLIELEIRLNDFKADLCALTEVLPKNQRFPLTQNDIKLNWYQLFSNIDAASSRVIW